MRRRELILPADPERVWEAVATPEGLSAWQFPSFVPSIRDIATAWDPPTPSRGSYGGGRMVHVLE